MAKTLSREQPLGNCKNLREFIREIITLFSIIEKCSPVLFRKKFREKLPKAIEEAQAELKNKLFTTLNNMGDNHDMLKSAGLSGDQLILKLESYNYAATSFDQNGTQENLVGLLDIISILLGSLLDALGIGSLVRELTDLMINEMKIRLPSLSSWLFRIRKNAN